VNQRATAKIKEMRASYYVPQRNSSWLTHVAISRVTDTPEHQFAEGMALVFAA
jgi:hypothetical protein